MGAPSRGGGRGGCGGVGGAEIGTPVCFNILMLWGGGSREYEDSCRGFRPFCAREGVAWIA